MSSSAKSSCSPYLWSLDDLDEALPSVAVFHGLTPSPVEKATIDIDNFVEWLSFSAAAAGLEVERELVPFGELEEKLLAGNTLVFRVGDTFTALVVLRATQKTTLVLGPDGRKVRLPTSVVRRFLESEYAPTDAFTEAFAEHGFSEKALRAVARTRNRNEVALFCVQIIVPPSARPFVYYDGTRLAKALLGLVALIGTASGLTAAGWAVLGSILLSSSVENAWLVAWAGIALTAVPVRASAVAVGGEIAVRLGDKLRQKIMMGTLLVNERFLQESGTGESMGRVLKSEELDRLLFSLVTSSIRVPIQAAVGFGLLLYFEHWVMLTAALVMVAIVARQAVVHVRLVDLWLRDQLGITEQLIEVMLGHPTRMVQSPVGSEREEDLAVEGYLQKARRIDASKVRLSTDFPWLWTFLAVSVIGWQTVFGDFSESPWYMGTAISTVLVFRGVITDFGDWIHSVSVARWIQQKVQVFLEAANEGAPRALIYRRRLQSQEHKLIEMKDVSFSYPASRPLFDHLDLTVMQKDHILLYGDSGAGKSTLASIMSGFLEPTAGVLFAGGLDSYSLGPDGWRRTTGVSPQFNENYIFSGTLAFNLLLGRQWPPNPSDMEDAREVLDALDLSGLLGRMPRGLGQPLGETGWQLSHGERSRIFLARALLQNAPLIILDENLGSLDAPLAAKALRLLTSGDKSLILITHE